MSLKKIVKKIKSDFINRHESLYKRNFYKKYIVPEQRFGQEFLIREHYKKFFGQYPDLDNPQTFNEKIQWLKLNCQNSDFWGICSDKLAVREFFEKNFGGEHLIPLLFKTQNWRDISPDNIPNEPCIVKANHGSGWYEIIRNKEDVDYDALWKKCMRWLNSNYYYIGMEPQYKNIEPWIIIEKLLVTKEGKIPNDYKLAFFNGELGFVYCSIDREGENIRNIYDQNWNPMPFTWGVHGKGNDIVKPQTFDLMVKIGAEIAKNFDFVRADFYDVDGKLYYGEITLTPGNGCDFFEPQSYDAYWGEKLKLTKK